MVPVSLSRRHSGVSLVLQLAHVVSPREEVRPVLLVLVVVPELEEIKE